MNSFLFTPKIQFLLVKAGSTDLDIQGRILGSLDLPLSEAGELEVLHTAHELAHLRLSAVYSAAGQAAHQTAKEIARLSKIKVRVDEKLTNMNCGLWHGKSIEELRATQPTVFKQWKEHPEAVRPPQGETVETVRQRAQALVKKIHRKIKSGLVVIVAPDPLLSIIRCEIEAKPLVGNNDRQTKFGSWELIEELEVVG